MSKRKKNRHSPDKLLKMAVDAWKNGDTDDAVGYLRAAASGGSVRAKQELKEVFGISEDIEDGEFVVRDGILKKYNGQDGRVVIPDGITYISEYAFDGNEDVTEVIIPESVQDIESYAFNGCSALVEIVIPDGIEQISNCAFRDCSALKSIRIPNSVKMIGDLAFSGCSSLENAVIPDGVESVELCAFSECTSLSSIVIPDSVEFVSSLMLDGCSALSRIICSDAIGDMLDGDVRDKTLGCFLQRLRDGAVSEEEKKEWLELISANREQCLRLMKNNAVFYRLATDRGWVEPREIDDIIESTDSLECRALLLDYKNNTVLLKDQ